MYDIYRYIFVSGVVLSVIMLAVSIILFFALRIPKVIGDLTGATARKAIQNIREQNKKTGVTTEKMDTNNLMPVRADETDVLNMNPLGSETTVLNQRNVSVPAFEVEYEITYIFSNEVISL